LRRAEVEQDYERHTGLVIAEIFEQQGIDPVEVPAALVASHGPFAWGPTPAQAIDNARVLEYLARLEWRVRTMAPGAAPPERWLIDKHYLRKHGASAYYGQK
jgi:L-ribulose-5-phosphate 4-epimerase